MDKKTVILDGFCELFNRAGTTSVSDIAKKAGIAKGRLYYDFRSKEEMLGALVVREYEDIIKACNELVEQSTCYATF
ncbi:MAG: helix-turn-helix transcriptional regulator [Clostridiales bacterium]|jgi:AcrR family transcriptional regulator|nr:helix-turn-helix transcriptional regulator [Clostridiales bacterium]